MGETHFPFDLPGFYDAELQAASDKLQIAIDEAAKIITDRRIEHKDRPMEIAIAKAIIKDKTGKEPETDTIGCMILEAYYDQLIEIEEKE